jgi:hypothetical protein
VQGLYCCVKETQYRAYAVAPVILITFTAIFAMTYLYYMVRHTHKERERERRRPPELPVSRVFVAVCGAGVSVHQDRGEQEGWRCRR